MIEQTVTSSSDRWFMLGLAWVIYFMFGMIWFALPPLVAPVKAELNLSYSEIGAILGSVQLTYVVVAIPIGLFIDRVGIRKSLALGLVLISISGILRSFAIDFKTLFASVVIFGLGGPFITLGLPKLIAIWFNGRERGIASGIYITGATLGIATALAITNSFLLPFTGSWQNTYRLLGVMGLAVLLAWTTLGRERGSGYENKGVVENSSKGYLSFEVIKNREVWLVVIIGFTMFITQHSLLNWLPQYLKEFKGMESTRAGHISSLNPLFTVLGSLTIPWLSDYVGKRKPFLVALLLTTGLALFLIATTTHIILIVSIIIIGASFGAFLPLLIVMLMENKDVGAQLMGQATGLLFAVGESGGFTGPLMMGLSRDITNSFLPAMMVLVVLNLVMIGVALMMKEGRERGGGYQGP